MQQQKNNTSTKKTKNKKLLKKYSRIFMGKSKKIIETSTPQLERERKNYSDYLYQNTAELNLEKFNKKDNLNEKEQFLFDAMVANEESKLIAIESLDRYELVANRITEHYIIIDKTNSSLTIKDLALQTHLILLPKIFIEPIKVYKIILKSLKEMWNKIKHGKVILFNEGLLFDSLKFGESIIPICAINSKLIPSKYIINFIELGDKVDWPILEAFNKILENALNSRFYVKLDNEIIILRKGKTGEEQNQLFASRESLNKNFLKVKGRQRSVEVYDEINLEDVISNKNIQIISSDKKLKNVSKKPHTTISKIKKTIKHNNDAVKSDKKTKLIFTKKIKKGNN